MRYLSRILIILALCLTSTLATAGNLSSTIEQTLPKIVKIYGAGGFQGMESYQTGTLISPNGHILTAWSHVLDTDEIIVVLHDGRRLQAELLGADPGREIAVLKIDAENTPHFSMKEATKEVDTGDRVLAFSNLFGTAAGSEPVSVQRGVVSIVTDLSARRGAFETLYRGPVYIVDAITNNPGAAGGALVTLDGQWLGMLGKELRNSTNDTWLNFAMPVDELVGSIDAILAGKKVAEPAVSRKKAEQPISTDQLGLVLIPDILPRTPPYLDQVVPNSAAANVGLRPDDLIVFIGDRLVQSATALNDELSYIATDETVELTILRNGQLVVVKLQNR